MKHGRPGLSTEKFAFAHPFTVYTCGSAMGCESGSTGREASEASAALRRKRPRRKQLRDHPFAVR